MTSSLGGSRSAAIGGLFALAMIGASMPAAGQQSGGFIFDSPREIRAGKELAEAQCAGCHGVDGLGQEDVPYLASQRPGYLYDELRAYAKGGRSHVDMSKAVRFLSDAALRQAAAYYGSLDPPLVETGGEAAEYPDPVALGEVAAEDCGGCHGETGVSEMPETPSLAGLHPLYIATATRAYTNGERDDETMSAMVEDVSEADLNNIALFYGLQPPRRSENEAGGDAGPGGKLAEACTGCHGEGGISHKADTPSLAGQDPEYLAKATRAYRDGARKSSAMESPVAELGDEDIANLAAFFAAQTPQAPNVRKPLGVREMAERCDRCHGVDGNSRDPHMPSIAGQPVGYVMRVLHEYREGKRRNKLMNAMLEPLGDASIEGLAEYYARKQPRAVVFVRVPANK